jgi:hypothetical protein
VEVVSSADPECAVDRTAIWLYGKGDVLLKSSTLKAIVTISATFSLGDVNRLLTLFEVKERVMTILSTLWAHVW